MTFLPIVDRELRVAARKPRTYWSRAGVALAAIVIALAVVAISELDKGTLRTQLGPILFGIFKFLSFAFACSAGVFLTSDCLSEEKRDGTLGLLFLTDLRGYDVVFGKLLANSLQAAYGLVAAFPVIGLSFLLGGVTWGEFWRLILLLFNTLFFSLALGVCVSAVSRDAQKAMNATLLVAVLFFLALPGIDWWMAGWKPAAFQPRLSLLSPTFAFTETGAIRPGNFWLCMAWVHGLAWLFLVVASVIAPGSWQEKAVGTARGKPWAAQRFRFGSPANRVALRRRFLELNPIAWLAIRDRWLAKLLWAVLACGLGLFALLVLTTDPSANAAGGTMGPVMMFSPLVWLLGALFKLWVAAYTCRFFVEARRNGALELLLVTSIVPATIVRGVWSGLRRIFLLPAVMLLIVQIVVAVMVIVATVRTIRSSMAASGNAVWNSSDFILQKVLSDGFDMVAFVTGLFAIAWFGMWMGLTSKKVNAAVIKTLVFVEILPALLYMLLFLILQFGLMGWRPGYFPNWLPQLIGGTIALVGDTAFILFARRKVLGSFRDYAAETSHSIVPARRPQPSSALEPDVPPVIVS